MIPSKFGMAPINTNLVSHHKNFNEPTETIFAQPNNSQSNQKYISQIIHTADPLLPIQKEREAQLLKGAIPKICSVSFYPQGNEFYIQPIYDFYEKNPAPLITSFFTVSDEPCTIFFECEDPNKLLLYLKRIPELPDIAISPQILSNSNQFIQLFCNFNIYCHIQAGKFVQVSDPEFQGDYAQIVSVNKERKKCLLKLIPRIDYEKIANYHCTSQLQLNDLMPDIYRPPKALFDKEKLLKINSNIEFGSKTIQLDNSEIELVTWSGKKFYGSFQYKSFHFDAIKTIFPNIPFEELDQFRSNIYSKEKHIRGFVENCELLYSELNKSSNITPSNSTEIELEKEEPEIIEEPEKPIEPTIQIIKTQKKKKSFFSVSKDPEVKQKIENSLKKERSNESKTLSKPEPTPEPINETKKESKKESKKEHKKEDPPPPKILPGMTVIPNYGQFAGLLCKVKSVEDDFVTAEVDDTLVSIQAQDFTLTDLYIEEKEDTCDIAIQSDPIEEIKKTPPKKQHKPHKKEHDALTNEPPLPAPKPEYESVEIQLDPIEDDFIPRENDLIMLSTGEEAMVIDESTIIRSSDGNKKKIKGSEILQSTVIPDCNSVSDSKGDRLSANEEVKITRGRHAGHFAQIVHVGTNCLFVRFNNEICTVKPEDTKKLNEDAQKVETEDILGEQIVLLKNDQVASKPMTIERIGTDGNIYVENTNNDPAKPRNFSVKMRAYQTKWMFHDDVPVEMRMREGRFARKKPKKKSFHDKRRKY